MHSQKQNSEQMMLSEKRGNGVGSDRKDKLTLKRHFGDTSSSNPPVGETVRDSE